jgi:lysophospholipase L1-like esterase
MSRVATAMNEANGMRVLGARFRSVTAVALLAVASGACGGDDSSTAPEAGPSTTPSSPTNMTPPATDPAPVTPAEVPTPSTPPPGAAAESPPGSVPLENPPPASENGGAGEGEEPPAPEGEGEGEVTPPEPTPEPEEPAAFNPCPTDGSPCRIMPLGDSITDGVGSSNPDGGYRVELFRQAVLDGHNITFVGTRPPNGPNGNIEGQPFPRNHEGISGNTIQQVSARIDSALATNPPDIVLLHIGTNNLYTGLPNGIEGLLGNLLDQIIEGAPDALVVVAQITPGQQTFNGFGGNGQPFNQTVQAYNGTVVSALVEERVAEGKHLVLVDMFNPIVGNPNFSNALLNDFVHPNNAGYAVMAETWYEAIENLLP